MRITNRVNQISYQIGKAASKYPLAKKLYHFGAELLGLLPKVEKGKVRKWVNVVTALDNPSKNYIPAYKCVSSLKKISLPDLIERYDLFFVDIHGVVDMGSSHLIPGAIEALNYINERKTLIFVSNNTDATPQEIAKNLEKIGLKIKEEQVVSSGLILTKYLKEKGYKKVINIGSQKTGQYIKEAGCEALQFTRKDLEKVSQMEIDAIVIGSRRGIQEEMAEKLKDNPNELVNFQGHNLDAAFNVLLTKRVPLLIANADDLVPHKNFTTLGPGALRRLFDWIPGIEIIVLGKPSPEIFEFALERAKQIRGREFEKNRLLLSETCWMPTS
jgi:HAD superfamily hydrolase (TIGR01450 family)